VPPIVIRKYSDGFLAPTRLSGYREVSESLPKLAGGSPDLAKPSMPRARFRPDARGGHHLRVEIGGTIWAIPAVNDNMRGQSEPTLACWRGEGAAGPNGSSFHRCGDQPGSPT
jgi:hypothetical protein